MDYSGGGFIDLRDLAKRYESRERPRLPRSRAVLDTSRGPSEESNASLRAMDVGNDMWELLPVSPGRSEGYLTPCTPQTPASLAIQTPVWFPPNSCQTKTSPLVSRYNRLHPDNHRLGSGQSLQIVTSEYPSPMTWNSCADKVSLRPSSPVELAGSLLLPSQGYPQSIPSVTPPRPTDRSHSDPTASRQGFAHTPTDMAKRLMARRDDDGSIPTDTQVFPTVPPPRLSSLPGTTNGPQHPPPPIPLSQMTMEELMQMLPKLDAAVIAADWIPCMQKRHRELKSWLQKGGRNAAHAESAKAFEKDLRHVMNDSKDVARTYFELFDVAKGLQDEELQRKTDQLEDARVQQSEALIALARYVSKHKEKCAEYERRIQDIEDNAQNTVSTLYRFIKQNFDEAIQKGTSESVQDIMNVLVQDPIHPSTHIRLEVYERTQEALRAVSNERDETKEICLQQSQHVRKQSKELDLYISRLSEMLGIVQAKEGKIAKLETRLKAMSDNKLEPPPSLLTGNKEGARDNMSTSSDISPLTESDGGDPPWVRDAEIINLRRKLEKAYERENELNQQVRQLVQDSHKDRDEKQPGMLKRFFINHAPQKSTTTLPTSNSMHDMSLAHLMPYHRDRTIIHPKTSPTRPGRLSPSLRAASESCAKSEPLGMPPIAIDKNPDFSPKPPLPVRPMVAHSKDDDIDTAVTQRFRQMPANLQSTASSPQPLTPNNLNGWSSEQLPRTPKQLQSQHTRGMDYQITESRNDLDDDRQSSEQYHRVLSGITEVTEGGSSTRTVRKSSSPDSMDRQLYVDSAHALERI